MVKTLHFSELAQIERISTDFAKLSSDYIVCHIEDQPLHYGPLNDPCRMQCLAIGFVRRGALALEVDEQIYEVEPDTLLVVGLSKIVRFIPDSARNLQLDLMFISPSFLQDLNFDLTAIDLHSLVENRPTPIIPLTKEEVPLYEAYFPLLLLNAKHNTDSLFSKNIGRSQVQSLIYQLLQHRANQINKSLVDGDPANPTRQLGYVQEFMRLLQLHHTRERSVAFYAEKLCISPKYLSHLIKEASGRSATDWIADVVVHEAKNMLRFSHKNIQQVAYELNFTTQSSFGKYFKHITGMSPTEYQRT